MHALTDTTYDHSILFPIHLARKCLIWNKKCSSFSETLSLLFVCVCVCLHVHSDTCISLLPLGLPDWVARVTYLTLRLVFLCWSSNYVDLGWRQSQDIVHRNILHGTICGTDFDVALKQILLPKWTLYWTLRTTRMALVLQWSSRWVHS